MKVPTLTTSQKIFITLCVLLVATIEVLDMTIVTVVLPDMMGELGANSDQITWVLTSYIIASAICMPLTGFLVDQLGRKKLLLSCVLGFLIASMLCGISQTLTQMIICRIFQGGFGAALVPLSQFILKDTFEPHEQRIAMAIWGIGIMTAPVLGPTLGGYIAEHFDWRWIFYINLPICLITLLLAIDVISETPKRYSPIDHLGLALLALGVGGLQTWLDRGNGEDWFQSPFIVMLMISSSLSLMIFVWRGLKKADNLIDLRVFTDKNFNACLLLLTLYTMALIATMAIQPLMLETLMHYSAYQAGLLLAPRGIASAIAMLITASLMRYLDSRLIIALGILCSAAGTFLMTGFTLQSSFNIMLWPSLLQGLGLGLFFVPITTGVFMTLPANQIANASGLFSFGRSIGSSIGISILSTVISRESQVNWQQLGSHLRANQVALQHWLNQHHLSLHQPKALVMLGHTLTVQANFIAFLDAFWIASLSYLFILPLIFFVKKIPPEMLNAPTTVH